jgi:hypothetical protein
VTFRVLTSFHYFRDCDMAELVTTLRDDYGGPVELFADSGAFSAATLGTTVSLPDYRDWLTDWRSVITTAATLDVIGDHQATARNTEALEAAGLTVLPTFHVGTPWPVLESLCARYRYLALGGMVPHKGSTKPLMRWLVRAFQIAAEHGTVFHGFGQTHQETNAALPFYSIDSSTWGSAARYGRLVVWDDHIHRLRPIVLSDGTSARKWAHLVAAHGADPVAVVRPGFARRAHRDKETYDAEQRAGLGVNAEAWQRFAAWLRHRHDVPPPPGQQHPGTVLYFADAFVPNLRHAACYLGARAGVVR